MKTWTKRILFTAGAVIGAAFCGILWWIYSHQIIAGEWREPTVQITDAKIRELEAIDREVLSYFYSISQTADLLNPYHVNKGNAWQREITERFNRIALGFETVLVESSTGELTQLAIPNHVTNMVHENGKLYLKAEWSHYSEDAIYRVSLDGTAVDELTPEQFAALRLEWIPLQRVDPPVIVDRFPQIETRLRRDFLVEPGAKNRYPRSGIPD